MNIIVKFMMGLGCVGMYFAWRHVPDTPVMGLAMSTLAMYGSLAVVAAGFVVGIAFGNEDHLQVDANRVASEERGEALSSMHRPFPDEYVIPNVTVSAYNAVYDDI